MSNKNGLKSSLTYSFIFQLFSIVVPFLTTPYISRVLGVENIGIYSYTTSIVGVFMLFATLGTSSYGAREIARHRNDKTTYSRLFWEIESFAILTSVITLFAWFIFMMYFEVQYCYYFIALTPMLLSVTFDISWLFNGLEMIKYNALRQMLFKTIGMVCLFIFVKTKNDLIIYAVMSSVILLVSNLSAWTHLKTIVERPQLTFKSVLSHFRENIVYFIPAIATSVYTLIDKTFIGLITKDAFQSGYYEQTVRITTIVISLVVNSINIVMGARTTFLFADNQYEEAKKITDSSLDFTILFSLGAIFGLCAVASDFVPLFLGDGYAEVVNYLYLYTAIIFFIGISNCLGSQYYTPIGLRTLSTKVIILAAGINLVLNILFIPFFGSVGAIISTIIAEALIALLYIQLSKGYVVYKTVIKYSWKRFIAGVLMLVVLLALNQLVFSLLIKLMLKIVIGAVVYVTLLILMKDKFILTGISLMKKKYFHGSN